MRTVFLILLFLAKVVYAKPISIVTNDNNPPYSFTLPDKTLTGIYVEFWQLWAKHNHQDINIYLETIENSLNDVKTKEVAHSGLINKDNRFEWAELSLPIHSVETGVLLSRKYTKSTLLKDLKDVKIAIHAQSNSEASLKYLNQSIEVEYFDDPKMVFDQLLSQEIDAIVADLPYIQSQLSKHELQGVFTLSDEILKSDLVYALIAKKNHQLLDTINKGIINIPIDEIIALEKKWLPNIRPFFSLNDQVPFLTVDENKWLKTHRNFSLGIDTSWYPFDFVDKKGEFSGIAADYINYLGLTLGINFSPEYNRMWTDSFELFKQGKIDVMSGIIATGSRKKTIDFTQSYFRAPTVIMTKKDTIYVGDIKDLNGKTLGLVKGFAVVDFVKKDYPHIKIELVNSIVEGLRKLQNGDIDAYLGTLSVVNYEIEKHGFDDLKISTFAPYKFEISMAVRKGLEPLIPILNKAFSHMSEKQKTSIANDWLAVHVATGTELKTILTWALPILTLLILIIIVIALFNKKLQIQIEQRKNAEQELFHLASHDTLTGLPNWRNFEANYNKIIKADKLSQKAILFLDLDGFKSVNDTFGHAQGDSVLIETANRLKQNINSKGFIARSGGDEFVVFLSSIDHKNSINNICDSIIQSISQPFDIIGNKINIGVSIGVSIYNENSTILNTLIQMADTAMYKAKNSGKNNFKYY